jgi:hypothetical protein
MTSGRRLIVVALFVSGCGTGPAAPVVPQPRSVSAYSDDPVAVTNATVIDVITGARQAATVVTRDGTINAIGPAIAVPPGAVRVDGTGKFLVPGLWDMHSHHEMTGMESLDLFLANGVVGARDMGSDADFILPLRDRINRGELLGPEIVAAGPILDALRPAGPLTTTPQDTTHYFASMRRRVTNAADGREAVRDLKQRGVDFIKVHDNTPREAFFAIAEEAKTLGLPLAGHVPHRVTVEEAVEAGIRSIEHLANFRIFRDCSQSPPHQNISCEERFNRLAAKAVWQTPTMAFAKAVPELFAGKPLPNVEYASDGLLASTRGNAEFSNLDERALASLRASYAASLPVIVDLVRRGNGMLAACDGLVPGFCVHDELQAFTDAGLSPSRPCRRQPSTRPDILLARKHRAPLRWASAPTCCCSTPIR